MTAYNKNMIHNQLDKQNKKAAVILGFLRPKNEVLLIDAIKSLLNQSYKNFDIYIYDNSELENSLEQTRKLFPNVIIKKNVKNNGFAGGNNSVMREVLKDESYEFVVLLNDDTKPTEKWLESLIEMALKSKVIGAVTSKLLFYEPYIRIAGKTQIFNPKQINIGEDTRDLGVKLFINDTKFANSNYSKKFLRAGLYGLEGDFSWSNKSFVIDLPIGESNTGDYELILSIEGSEHISNQTLELSILGFSKTINISKEKSIYKFAIPNKIIEDNKFNLVQNAGSGITAQFNGYDIGSLNGDAEIDKGQYDSEREVEAVCGGAVLFRASTLRKVGIFDEYYFVYYEDSDLSLRIKHRGYKLLFAPNAVVRHIHAGSSTEYSPLFTYHVWKNKPAFVIKNFGVRPSLYALKELAAINLREFKGATKHKFKNGHHNSRLKVIIKSTLVFYINLPLLLLKKFNVIKSN